MATLTLSIDVENIYGGDSITNEYDDIQVAYPPTIGELDEWAEDELFPYTGTGRSGDAGYFVQITKCEDRPDLVGREFEWYG